MKEQRKTKIPIVIDTREQQPWQFEEQEFYSFDREYRGLATGDYTILGLERMFVIERKASTSEVARNILESRFEEELKRLTQFNYPFIVCEFEIKDIVMFPMNSGIPHKLWDSLKITGPFLMKKIIEFQISYGIPWIFAGDYAEEFAVSLIKRMYKELKNGHS